MEDPLKNLEIADPGLAESVRGVLSQKGRPIPPEEVSLLVNEALWALSEEVAFGRAVAEGYAGLVGEAGPRQIERYRGLVREFGARGPTLGRMMAAHLVPVFKTGVERLVESFLRTVEVMLDKGAYTLKEPLELLPAFLDEKDLDAAFAYLDLLKDTFGENLSYVQSQHFAHVLPRSVKTFPAARRVAQIRELQRAIRADVLLADAFLDGFEKGLQLLSGTALNRFVSLSLEKLKQGRRRAMRFLALESQLGRDTFAGMQVIVPLSLVRPQLNRYLRARTGLSITARPLCDLPAPALKAGREKIFACSDGKHIYLPAEISRFARKAENAELYKCFARLESGYYEFGTFDFDLEKAEQRCGGLSLPAREDSKHLSDMEAFFQAFALPALAADLFTVFEHGRLRVLLGRQYPGLVSRVFPVLLREAARMPAPGEPAARAVFGLYCRIALGDAGPADRVADSGLVQRLEKIVERFEGEMKKTPAVEVCAELTAEAYPEIADLQAPAAGHPKPEQRYRPLDTPFGRRIRPDLFWTAFGRYDAISAQIKARIMEKGLKIYKSDIRRHLIHSGGAVSPDDLKVMIACRSGGRGPAPSPAEVSVDLSWLDLSEILGGDRIAPVHGDDVSVPVFWYQEWDDQLHDYLPAHVRVLDRTIPEHAGDFYDRTLGRHRGLVKSVRHAFELLKPEGLVRLRQWVEGDEFDYRALLDFAVDKKAGKIPSDRLYIKRIKQTRDVAVLLLVDLSRSTAHAVNGSRTRVLDVEKEAIVLLCEALQVVGDAFAIAGFSGTGRLGVDYYRIKDFDQPMDDAVKHRIHAMAPQRSTRMGAAIRHAARQLEKITARVRLLIILGDGFPNDLEYKQNYAICDTAKAIFEARSKNIYAHAITVNMASDPRLDELYGDVRHNVISDVRELPGKLLRIYGGLTRR